jgi:hypothetical protein
LPDSLKVHLRSCQKGKVIHEEQEYKLQVEKSASKPKGLTCYICGRQFGTQSLPIHLKSCQKKWENEQLQKPPKERRPCPTAPEKFDNMLDEVKVGGLNGRAAANAVNQYNEDAFDNFNTKALEACHNCGRTFLPDSLKIHLKSCDNKYGKLREAGGAAEE